MIIKKLKKKIRFLIKDNTKQIVRLLRTLNLYYRYLDIQIFIKSQFKLESFIPSGTSFFVSRLCGCFGVHLELQHKSLTEISKMK